MAWQSSRGITLASLVALSASLAACGPDDARVDGPDHYSMLDNGYEWPLDTYGFADAGDPGGLALPPLPAAQPMAYAPQRQLASYARDYGFAPRYYDDYDSYYDPEPADYADNAGTDSFAYLALAALLGGVLADSPPDYYFDYDGVQPWVWRTGDRYTRYAEPIRGGYRYYYYEPGAARPFLVRDPYYSYGYRDRDLVVVYDRRGRVLDRNRVWAQRRVASRYYDRGADLYRASLDRRHRGVAAPLWQRQRTVIVNDQRDWERARANRDGWRTWTRMHQPAVDARWAQEQAARRYATNRFDKWRSADYRGSAPRFYREARQNASVRKAVAAQQRQVAARQRQRVARMERAVDRDRRSAAPAVLRRQQIEQRADRRIAATTRAARIERQADARRAQVRRANVMARRDNDAVNRESLARRTQQAQAQQRRSQQAHVQQRRSQQVQAQQRRAQQAQVQQRRSQQVQAQQRRAQQAQVQQRRSQQVQAQQRRAEQAQAQQRRSQQAQVQERRAEQAQVQQRRAQQAQVQQRRAQQAQVQQRRAQQAPAQQRRAQQAQVQQHRAQQAQAQQRRSQQAQAQQRRSQQAQVHQRRSQQAQAQQRRSQQAQAQQRRAQQSQARASQQRRSNQSGANSRRFANRDN